MSILPLVDDLQTTLDRLRAEAAFHPARNSERAAVERFADAVELVIARRLELLNNWTPALAGGIRKHELVTIRDAIRNIPTD